MTFGEGSGRQAGDGVLCGFGGDPASARMMTVPELAETAYGHPPMLAVHRDGGWIVGVEVNGFEGARPEVLRRVSHQTQTVSVQRVMANGWTRGQPGVRRDRGWSWTWLVGRRLLGEPQAWIGATAVAMGIGLVVGAWVVDYGTSLGELALMGAITGIPLGVAQASLLRDRLANAWVWAALLH